MAQKPAIIIDNGSYMTKAGFVGEIAPKIEFVTKVGRPRHLENSALNAILSQQGLKDWYIGDEAEAKRGILSLKYPVERGIIDKWDGIEKIWEHTFEQLQATSEEHPVFLTEIANNPKTTREKMAEVMMEKFNTPALFIGIQGVLSLYAAGHETGTTLSIGEGVTQVTPVDKGYAIPGASTCLKLGGRDLMLNLGKMLVMDGRYERYEALHHYQNQTTHCRNMVKKLCYVALDFEKELQCPPNKAKEESYELPCGNTIALQDEKFRCPELLFKPSLLGNLNEHNIEEGIHKVCFDTISKCDLELHPMLYKSIVLSGGCTMFQGFPERLEKEIQDLVSGSQVKVIAPETRKNSVWIGASLLGSLTAFKDMWITKEQYLEQGPAAIHKCPSA